MDGYTMGFRKWLDKSGYFMSKPSGIHEILFEAWCAAQHRMHLTAFGAFLAGGFVGGLLMLIVLVGLYGGR